MEELVNKLNAIPDTYFGFVAGIVAYVKQKPSRLEIVMDYLNSSDSLTSSDVVKYVMDQPDFHEYGMDQNKAVVWVSRLIIYADYYQSY